MPVTESINLAAEKLYSMEELPPVDKETFKTLAHLCCSDVLLAYGNGVYIQKEGLAMGCKPAPMLANIWLSQFDNTIKGDGDIYFRYMDDCRADISEEEGMTKLNLINSLHPNLKFTIETIKKSSEKDEDIEKGRINFLDMELIQKVDGSVEN